jgi:multiple antibiotic resistance protein
MFSLNEALHATLALVAVVNPLASLPMSLALTSGRTSEQRRRTALLTVAAVVAICAIAAALGEWLLMAFSIHTQSFRIAGGLVILLAAFGMLRDADRAHDQGDSDDSRRGREPHEVAIVPLAMPLLAGPGAITTIIVYLHHVPGAEGYVMIAAGQVCSKKVVSGSWHLCGKAPGSGTLSFTNIGPHEVFVFAVSQRTPISADPTAGQAIGDGCLPGAHLKPGESGEIRVGKNLELVYIARDDHMLTDRTIAITFGSIQ